MIKKFTAPTVKEAIQLAKEHFGDDAIILQTKKSEQESGEPDMFELTAMSENNSPSVPEKPAQRKSAKLFYTQADLKLPQKNNPAKSETERGAEWNQLKETIKDMSLQILRDSPHIPSEASFAIGNIDSPSFLVNFISSNMNADVNKKQEMLEELDMKKRVMMVLEHLSMEVQMLEMKKGKQMNLGLLWMS